MKRTSHITLVLSEIKKPETKEVKVKETAKPKKEVKATVKTKAKAKKK